MKKNETSKTLTEDQDNKLSGLLAAFLLINPQSESAMLNLQKMVDILDDKTKADIYNLAKQDLTARTKRQIAALNEQLQRM